MKMSIALLCLSFFFSGVSFASGVAKDANGKTQLAQEALGTSRVFLAHDKYTFFEIRGDSAEALYHAMNSPEIEVKPGALVFNPNDIGDKTKYGVGGQLACTQKKVGGYECSLGGVNTTTGEIYDAFNTSPSKKK